MFLMRYRFRGLFVGLLTLLLLGPLAYTQENMPTLEEKEALINPKARAYNGTRDGGERASCYGDPLNLAYPFDPSDTSGWTQSMSRNDDSSTGVIALPFTFPLYGDDYTQCWINNNGNISFDGPYWQYVPEGFPSTDYVMVAPFWQDVDTRAYDIWTGLVWHKFVDSNGDSVDDTLVVTWDNVGYYSQHVDMLNTFQVAISDGTNPDMGIGYTFCFSYDNMCWTSGDIDGDGGFGGAGATVGCNRGNGVDYFQVGRFNQPGTAYDGPYGNPDGVSWLDGQLICGNTGAANVPPIPAGFPEDNEFNISSPDILDARLSFLSPEPDQTTAVTVDDLNGAQAAGLQMIITNGNTATVDLYWETECQDEGTYVLHFTATDDGSPPGVTEIDLTINIVCSGPECDCVDECDPNDPDWDVDVMSLEAAGQCIPEPTGPDECSGPFLEIELWQRNLDQLVVGYQAFMCFNPRYIRVCDIELTDSPYGLHMISEWDNELGTITLIAGIDEVNGQEPTDDDAVLAIIRIEGLAEFCEFDPDLANQICFREHLPPTRFSDPDGHPVYPCLIFTGNLFIDWTEPDCTCPGAVTVQCVDEVPDYDCDLVVCTDDCDPNAVCTWEGDTSNGGAGCPDNPLIITRKYRCTDFCGNYCECTQTITVVDNTPPEITCPDPVGVECYEDVPPFDPNDVEVSDNCWDPNDPNSPAPVVEWVADEDNKATGCPGDPRIIVRTYRATDVCENSSECQQIITVVDTTPPEIECPPDEGYECAEEVPDYDPNNPDPRIQVSDNCWDPNDPNSPAPVVTWEGDVDNGGSGCEDDPLIIRRTYRATDFCDNFSECIQTITVVDTTDPEIICPPDENYQCVEEVPDYDPNNPDPRIQVSDNCWDPNDPNSPAPYVTWEGDEDNNGDGCPDSPLIITRTYRVTDFCGNFSECEQTITVIDTIPPQIGRCPEDVEVECVQDVPEPNLEGVCFADNCWDPDDPNSPAPLVTHEGDVDNDGAGCDDDPLIITRTFRVTDFCGNYSECTQTITVIDRSPPEFPDGCQPLYVTVYPNAGECDAYVCLPVPAAADNCDDDVEVVGARSDGLALDEPYPPGETTVWWSAIDDCGNQNLCFQFVEVMDENLLVAHVELQGILVSPLSRCITFELWNCPGDEPVHAADRVITFVTNNVDRSAGTTELHVPCALYNCMTAQDRLHTTRSTAELGIIEYTDEFTCPDMVRTKYSAEYRNPRPDGECEYPSELGHWLLCGNFDFCNWPDDCDWPDCDYWVDILDFGVFWNQLNAGACYDSDGDGVPDGNTTRPPCDQFMHADANGDGCVLFNDYPYFRVNLLCAYEPNCCGAPGAAGRGPIVRISVEELHARGWDELAGADLNHDGWLDMQDVEAFENGAWKPEVSPSDGGQQVDPDGVRRP